MEGETLMTIYCVIETALYDFNREPYADSAIIGTYQTKFAALQKLDELKANVKKHDIDQEDDESFMFETVDDQFQYTIQEIQVPFA